MADMMDTMERGSAEMVHRNGMPRRGDDGARERVDGESRSERRE